MDWRYGMKGFLATFFAAVGGWQIWWGIREDETGWKITGCLALVSSACWVASIMFDRQLAHYEALKEEARRNHPLS